MLQSRSQLTINIINIIIISIIFSYLCRLCNKEKIPLIPFGTGTGLEGGVTALKVWKEHCMHMEGAGLGIAMRHRLVWILKIVITLNGPNLHLLIERCSFVCSFIH